MCLEIKDKIQEFQENGMPPKVSKTVEKMMIKTINRQLSELNCEQCNSKDCNCQKLIKNLKEIALKEKSIYTNDVLALTTQLTRILFSRINKIYLDILNSKFYKTIITQAHTQPAHIIATLILIFFVYIISPEILGYGHKQKHILANIIYLVSVATHFGALIWMTFFSGLALYFSLPRHIFGQCQHVLFPMYYTLNSFLSLLAFTSYVKIKSGDWNKPALFQATMLGVCATTEIIVRLYLSPILISLMKVKYNFEKMRGSGAEIGYLDQKDLTKCPHYQAVNRRFRKIHTVAALSNMTALVCSVIHMVYLAQKISIS